MRELSKKSLKLKKKPFIIHKKQLEKIQSFSVKTCPWHDGYSKGVESKSVSFELETSM